jgi:hypothetical protein
MRRSASESSSPLSVSDRLDAMLLGRLERRAARREPPRADLQATAVISVADSVVPELEAFCSKWAMTIARFHRGNGDWTVLEVQGPILPVQGFAEIAATYRRRAADRR